MTQMNLSTKQTHRNMSEWRFPRCNRERMSFPTNGVGTIGHSYTKKEAGSKLYTSYKNSKRGLPWWCSGWESAYQCRGHGFEPWSGKIPHAVERLGPWAMITETARLEPVLRNKGGRDSERLAHRDEEWPLLATSRKSPRTETKTQHSQK